MRECVRVCEGVVEFFHLLGASENFKADVGEFCIEGDFFTDEVV